MTRFGSVVPRSVSGCQSGASPGSPFKGANVSQRPRPDTLRRVSRLAHAATVQVEVPAETAFAYVADGLRQSDWTLGSWNREDLGDGLFRGMSLFDGALTYVRIDARPSS